MIKKLLLLLLLLPIVSAQYSYGEVINQTEYDSLNFNRAFLNDSYTLGINGGIRMSCNSGTMLCQGLLSWDTFIEETENVTTYDMETRSNYTWFNPTGNYVFVRKTKLMDISYLTYLRALRISQGLATRWATYEFNNKADAKMLRELNKLELKQTSQTQIISLGATT